MQLILKGTRLSAKRLKLAHTSLTQMPDNRPSEQTPLAKLLVIPRRRESSRFYPVWIPAFSALLNCLSSQVIAACPPAPTGFTEPVAVQQPVDLTRELESPWQAGGQIVLICTPEGAPKVGRLLQPPRNQAAEQVRRTEQFAIARRINLARKGEAHPLGLPLAAPELELLERFALSDAGAVWLRAITDDTLRLFNRGYLEYDPAVWRRGIKQGRLPPLSELLTGHLTETAQFADDADIFMFSGYAGPGAMAHPGAVGLGDAGMRERFPASKEWVDPFAIISHELGHTRYGDPTSAGSLQGEANTVMRYENPVRIRNGFPPRALYFVSIHPSGEALLKRNYVERMLAVERVKGIAVNERTAFDRYRIGLIPIILDCADRARPAPEIRSASFNSECKLNWKPDATLFPYQQLLRWAQIRLNTGELLMNSDLLFPKRMPG